MFPEKRMRRVRRRKIRPFVQENHVLKTDLIAPVFVDENAEKPVEIPSMPGQFRYPLSYVADLCNRFYDVGIIAVILFGIPAKKDEYASSAFDPRGVIQQAVRQIKQILPEMLVITDLCACEYSSHGHCGIIGECVDGTDLKNDESLELMNRIAVSHAEAGADIVAPSCMLDGMVGSIRSALDLAGFDEIAVMSYSSKFASSLYGPFRDAADSGFSFGDRSTYQMNPANRREAFMESQLDAAEGADFLMVKPGSWFLDVVSDVHELLLPVVVYQVSGEYSMIKAASQNGWLDEKRVVLENLVCMKRAGADLIITYFAEDVCRWIDEQ